MFVTPEYVFKDVTHITPEWLAAKGIRALGLEDYMERRYDRCIGDGYAAMERTNFYDAVYSPVVLLLNAVVVGIVMLLSASGNAQLLTLFGMSVGTSVAVINYISRIFAPIESLGMEIQTIQSAMAGVRRIDAFLDQPERTIPPARREAARGDVEFAHVTFGYGERHVLKDFSMTVKQGEQVTLVGRTGAGKSTVFKLLLGLYQPEAGTVTIGGVKVGNITDRERRTCIGCVEQHFSRVPGTVLEQITLGDPQITGEMAKDAAALAAQVSVLESRDEGFALLDASVEEPMKTAIRAAGSEGDSVGGMLETAILGLPAGIGEPYFDSVESPPLSDRYTDETAASTRSAQALLDLPETGVADAETWTAVEALSLQLAAVSPNPDRDAGQADAYPGRAMKEGSVGPDVGQIEQWLNGRCMRNCGEDYVTENFRFGPKETEGVRAAQERADLLVTGTVNEETWAALRAQSCECEEG